MRVILETYTSDTTKNGRIAVEANSTEVGLCICILLGEFELPHGASEIVCLPPEMSSTMALDETLLNLVDNLIKIYLGPAPSGENLTPDPSVKHNIEEGLYPVLGSIITEKLIFDNIQRLSGGPLSFCSVLMKFEKLAFKINLIREKTKTHLSPTDLDKLRLDLFLSLDAVLSVAQLPDQDLSIETAQTAIGNQVHV